MTETASRTGDAPAFESVAECSCNGGEGGSALPAASGGESRVVDYLRAVEKHRSRFLWVAARMMRGAEQEAEDVVQEALLRAFRNLYRFRAESQMSTWLRAIVQNAAREHMRNRKGRVFLSLDGSPSEEDDNRCYSLPDPAPNPEQHCERRECEELAHSAIRSMPPASRRVLEMCVFEERPYLEVATLLNVTVGTIKSTMFRSRIELRKAIRQLGNERRQSRN